MARHTIQIPIIKSSCEPGQYLEGRGGPYAEFYPNPIGELLYIQRFKYGEIYSRNIAFAWNLPEYVKNKNIINTELHLYSTKIYNKAIGFRLIDFNEGSSLPEVIGYNDGVFETGFYQNQWMVQNLGGGIHDSVVLGAMVYDETPDITFGILHSHRNLSNKPYVIITYDDVPPGNPKSLYPSNILLNPRDIIKFSWLHDSKEGQIQKSFTFQYSINGGSTWTTVTQTTANEFYDMPASTLPASGTIMWKVKTTDTNSEESTYSEANFTVGIVPQKAPIPISPISQYIDENNPIRFEWVFTGGSQGETQSKYDLQYSINSGSTWTTITITSENYFYDLIANSLDAGNVTWRIRTYNNWNEVSPYSENRSFTVIGSPSIPQILGATNRSRPTITWQATGQHIYELEVIKDNKVIFSTGAIPSLTDRNFKMEDYLEDGNYIVRLRILNEYNLYSPWAEKSFILATVKPPAPTLDIYSNEYSVTIKTADTSLKTLVYRDGVLLGEAINDIFTDYTGENNKVYKYFIRTVDINDNFADSELKLANCHFSDNTLALASQPSKFVKLTYGFGNVPKKTNKNGVVGNLNYYDGRINPVAEFTEFEIKEKTLAFFLETKEELDSLNEMINKRQLLLYRDSNGETIHGVIFEVSDDKTIFGYEVGFTIIKTEV